MLLCFALICPLLGYPWWLIPNLLSARVFTRVLLQPGMATLTGAASLLLGTGIVGAFNGLFTPGGRLFGLAVAAASYLFCYWFLWKKLAPLMLLHAPQPLVIAGFFVYGSVLGYHPQLRRALDH